MVLNLILAACVVYIGVALSLYFLQARMIYFPERTLVTTPANAELPYEEVSFDTVDGLRLHGWFVPAGKTAPSLLFFHGNAGNISHRLESLLIFHQLGLNTFIFDYRGYGKSEGSPSEEGTYRDAEAAWGYLTETRGITPANIILFGRSLGGAVATWLASRVAANALIVESSFTSVPDLAARMYPFLPVRLLARFQYNTQRWIGEVRYPVLVIHSPHDEIIPFDHGRSLFESANEPKHFLAIGGGHNDGFLVSEKDYRRGISTFLDTVVSARESDLFTTHTQQAMD